MILGKYDLKHYTNVRIPQLQIKTQSRLTTEPTQTSRSKGEQNTSRVSAKLFRAKSKEVQHLLTGEFDGRKLDSPVPSIKYIKPGNSQQKKYNHLFNVYLKCKGQINRGELTGRGYSRFLTKTYSIDNIKTTSPQPLPKIVSYLINGNKLEERSRFKAVLRQPQQFNSSTIELTRKLYDLIHP